MTNKTPLKSSLRFRSHSVYEPMQRFFAPNLEKKRCSSLGSSNTVEAPECFLDNVSMRKAKRIKPEFQRLIEHQIKLNMTDTTYYIDLDEEDEPKMTTRAARKRKMTVDTPTVPSESETKRTKQESSTKKQTDINMSKQPKAKHEPETKDAPKTDDISTPLKPKKRSTKKAPEKPKPEKEKKALPADKRVTRSRKSTPSDLELALMQLSDGILKMAKPILDRSESMFYEVSSFPECTQFLKVKDTISFAKLAQNTGIVYMSAGSVRDWSKHNSETIAVS